MAVTLGLLAHGRVLTPAEWVTTTVLAQSRATFVTTVVEFQSGSKAVRSEPSVAKVFRKTRHTSGVGYMLPKFPLAITWLLVRYWTLAPYVLARAFTASS